MTQLSMPTIGILSSPKMIDHALIYKSWGLSIIPICVPIIGGIGCYQHGSGCPSPGKKPLIFSDEFHKRLPLEGEIKHWWSMWPNANIGIITGNVSHNLVVIDADDSSAVAILCQLYKSNNTPIVRSQRGGRHLYFAGSNLPGVKTSVAVHGFHMDVRAEGVYVVAPPSIGPTGVRYEWLIKSNDGEFPIIPNALYEFIVK